MDTSDKYLVIAKYLSDVSIRSINPLIITANKTYIKFSIVGSYFWKGVCRLSKVRGSWFLEATDFCHPQARQIHRCIFAPVTSVNAHYYSVLTTPFCNICI
jgi:hypothetical protein